MEQVLDIAKVKMPTFYGEFTLWAFQFAGQRDPTLALIKGDPANQEGLPVRLHSSCATGDIFGSERCDCGPQLQFAMNYINQLGKGVVIYLHQEGRGIGLFQKMRAYELQEMGFDTLDANIELGLPVDCRDYSSAVTVLQTLKVQSIKLMSNNPEKQRCLVAAGIRVDDRIPVHIEPNPNNREYLVTKQTRMGHHLPALLRRSAEGSHV